MMSKENSQFFPENEQNEPSKKKPRVGEAKEAFQDEKVGAKLAKNYYDYSSRPELLALEKLAALKLAFRQAYRAWLRERDNCSSDIALLVKKIAREIIDFDSSPESMKFGLPLEIEALLMSSKEPDPEFLIEKLLILLDDAHKQRTELVSQIAQQLEQKRQMEQMNPRKQQMGQMNPRIEQMNQQLAQLSQFFNINVPQPEPSDPALAPTPSRIPGLF